ncbi:YceD family protein [Fusibacter sp. JL216-2]|uniref:YceD family protein n=1 Tax=Fusibacter sp. JL216-2 TaxID=3071453 RepID=UPI003D33415D
MRINVSDVLNGKVVSIPVELEMQLDNEIMTDHGIESAKPVRLEGQVYKVDDDVLVDVTYEVELKLSCDRCLKDVTMKIDGRITRDILEEQHQDPDHEAMQILIDHELDLQYVLKEDLLLNMPMQVLCDPECQGLCPVCGADLNTDPCDCDNEKIDPRLEGLKDFFR